MILAMSYAKALLESTKEAGANEATLVQIETQLKEFAATVQGSKNLWFALTGPSTTIQEKTGIVSALCQKLGHQSALSRFLALVATKNRMSAISDISDAYVLARVEMDGGVLGRVKSADPMDKSDLDALTRSFTAKLGRKVVFQASVDPELLAGVRVTVNGVTYDGTLRAQLDKLKTRVVTDARA